MKKILLLTIFISTLAISLSGCVAGPQYFPSSLEGEPEESMAELKVDMRTKRLLIDNKVAINRETYLEPDPIFIAPGSHQLRFTVYGETTQWRDFTESMKRRGYTLSADGKLYERNVGGVPLTQRADAVARFGWHKRTKEVLLEAGKVYNLSGF
ncbi:MAG: hypothetical protein IME99_07835 [Proteobacteria bacterium]|nr:hypothetical protein [Pseudomonadota bacterium]